jgi:uracil-DNA glycosylase family 4
MGDESRQIQMEELEREMFTVKVDGKIGVGSGNIYPNYILLGINPGCNLKDDRVFMKPEGIGSSQVLLPILDQLGIWDECYFDNIVKSTTEKNILPNKELVDLWTPFLVRELNILDYTRTKVIALGNFASKILTDLKIKHIKISHPARHFHGYSLEEYTQEIKNKIL